MMSIINLPSSGMWGAKYSYQNDNGAKGEYFIIKSKDSEVLYDVLKTDSGQQTINKFGLKTGIVESYVFLPKQKICMTDAVPIMKYVEEGFYNGSIEEKERGSDDELLSIYIKKDEKIMYEIEFDLGHRNIHPIIFTFPKIKYLPKAIRKADTGKWDLIEVISDEAFLTNTLNILSDPSYSMVEMRGKEVKEGVEFMTGMPYKDYLDHLDLIFKSFQKEHKF